MKIINFTHSDLDGVVCSIIMSHLFKDHLKLGDIQQVQLNYVDTEQMILNTLNSQKENVFVIITDLRIETKFLKTILKMDSVFKLVYIDHHEREDDRRGLDSLMYVHKEKFIYIWRIGYSASELSYQLAKKQNVPITDKLNYLVQCADLYDEWRIKDKRFQEGFNLNEIYWEFGFEKFFEYFYEGLVWNDEINDTVKTKLKEQDDFFKENDENYCQIIELKKDRKLLVSFNPQGKFNNLYTLRYDADLFLLFAYETGGLLKFSVRSKNSYFDCNLITKNISKYIKDAKGGGHKGASGLSVPAYYKLEEIFEAFMQNLEEIYNI